MKKDFVFSHFAPNIPDKLNQLEAGIKYKDEKINRLVFKLYGLNEEVGIVEGGRKNYVTPDWTNNELKK